LDWYAIQRPFGDSSALRSMKSPFMRHRTESLATEIMTRSSPVSGFA
jgi:hypothetical protein